MKYLTAVILKWALLDSADEITWVVAVPKVIQTVALQTSPMR